MQIVDQTVDAALRDVRKSMDEKASDEETFRTLFHLLEDSGGNRACGVAAIAIIRLAKALEIR
jgi:hypothetical protein